MPKGYVVAQIDIDDEDTYAKYRAGTPGSIQAFGGRFLVRGGALESLEGEPPPARMVVIEFPSMVDARSWYESDRYQALRVIRQSAATGNVMLVEGAD